MSAFSFFYRERRICALLPLMLGSLLFLPSAGSAQPPPPPPPPEESNDAASPAPPSPGQTPAPSPAPAPTGGSAPGGRYLLLPDISLNGIFLGHLSTDKRDQTRERFRLEEGEIGVQSYVYPGIKLDTFIVFAGEGGVTVEEAYLTYQNISLFKQQFSAVIGRRKSPFGRVNQLHPHSWLYDVQPYVLTNLVSAESLTGDGGYLSYLLPTKKLFAQLDIGAYTQSEPTDAITRGIDTTQEVLSSPGVGFADKYATARLVLAREMLGGSAEIGGSLAGGRGVAYGLTADGGETVRPDLLLSGLDVTYRREGTGAQRFLLRGEYLQHRQKDHSFRTTTDGFYVFADQRLDAFNSLGVRYDSSGFPYAAGHEQGISLMGTHALTEATLYRLQLIHGDRPGKRNVNEIYFQIIFGAGPHTHNLE